MKIYHLAIAALGIVAILWSKSYAVDPGVSLKTKSRDPDSCVFSLVGEISQRSVEDFRSLLETPNCGDDIWLYLNSPGGDVSAAMAIGRLVRKSHAKTLVEEICASACVFVYIGGVVRFADSLGLHRPFAVDSTLNYEESIKQTGRFESAMLQYVKEMNVSTRLIDEMNVVPPNDIRWLKGKELESLIGEEDPAFGDWNAGRAASRLGISKEEFFRRQQFGHISCDHTRSQSGDGQNVYETCWHCILTSGDSSKCAVSRVANGSTHEKNRQIAATKESLKDKPNAANRVLLVCTYTKFGTSAHYLVDYDAQSVSDPDTGELEADVRITLSRITMHKDFVIDRITGDFSNSSVGTGHCEVGLRPKF